VLGHPKDDRSSVLGSGGRCDGVSLVLVSLPMAESER
jgi:hypothetical protein